MKTKNLKIFTFIIYFLVLVLIFVLIGYIYLSCDTEDVDRKTYSEAYEYTPENCGVFIDLPYGKSFYYLDFKQNEIKSFLPTNLLKAVKNVADTRSILSLKAKRFYFQKLLMRSGKQTF